jgi:hypothetical protein
MIFSRSAGTASGAFGSSFKIADNVDIRDSPTNARCPVTIS